MTAVHRRFGCMMAVRTLPGGKLHVAKLMMDGLGRGRTDDAPTEAGACRI